MNVNSPSIPRDGRHRYHLRVYYEDTDAGGVVYHASYLRFAERARTEALREMGIPHAEMVDNHNLMFMVRRIEIDYVRPARPDDSLVVETAALEVGGASVQLRQVVIGPSGPCADLRVRLACVRLGGTGAGERRAGGNKPGRIPPRWRQTLNALRDAGQEGVQGIGSGS
jgi:acyl-CoA thioester hydrolase